ncbi:8198_t:CDS:2, partial [Diversispora eburnea]
HREHWVKITGYGAGFAVTLVPNNHSSNFHNSHQNNVFKLPPPIVQPFSQHMLLPNHSSQPPPPQQQDGSQPPPHQQQSRYERILPKQLVKSKSNKEDKEKYKGNKEEKSKNKYNKEKCDKEKDDPLKTSPSSSSPPPPQTTQTTTKITKITK